MWSARQLGEWPPIQPKQVEGRCTVCPPPRRKKFHERTVHRVNTWTQTFQLCQKRKRQIICKRFVCPAGETFPKSLPCKRKKKKRKIKLFSFSFLKVSRLNGARKRTPPSERAGFEEQDGRFTSIWKRSVPFLSASVVFAFFGHFLAIPWTESRHCTFSRPGAPSSGFRSRPGTGFARENPAGYRTGSEVYTDIGVFAVKSVKFRA